jgi:hypothetical protein
VIESGRCEPDKILLWKRESPVIRARRKNDYDLASRSLPTDRGRPAIPNRPVRVKQRIVATAAAKSNGPKVTPILHRIRGDGTACSTLNPDPIPVRGQPGTRAFEQSQRLAILAYPQQSMYLYGVIRSALGRSNRPEQHEACGTLPINLRRRLPFRMATLCVSLDKTYPDWSLNSFT